MSRIPGQAQEGTDPGVDGMVPQLNTTELMVVAFIALLILGNRLPSVMRSLGEGVKPGPPPTAAA